MDFLTLAAGILLACPQKHAPETEANRVSMAESQVTGFVPWWQSAQFPGLVEVEELVFHYTNEERKRHGKPPLAWSEPLRAASRQHSQEMLEKNYFDHRSPVAGHQSPMERAYLAGFFGLTGENILSWTRHQASSAEAVAREMVADWMNSPGHRANILRDRYNQLGVGVVKLGNRWMATQVFGDATFTFSDVRLVKEPSGSWRLSGTAQLVPGQRFSHAAISVDGVMGPAFAIPPDGPFTFQVPIPPGGRHKVGIRPGDGSSFWVFDHFLIEGGFKPLSFD